VDIVFTDLMMDDMDGFEEMEQIRQLEQQQGVRRRVRLVSCSGSCLEEDRAKAFLSGADDFLSKPFGPQQVAEQLACLRR
jgi:CheY-like chemotaxis protein